MRSTRRDHAAAGDHEGAGRRAQPPRGGLDVGHVTRRPPRRRGRRQRRLGTREEQVVRDRQRHRPRPPAARQREGGREAGRDRRGLAQRLGPARDRTKAVDLVRHLVQRAEVAADERRGDVGHDHEHGHGAGIGLGERRERVGGRRPAGHHDHARRARGARVAVGHERRALLVAREDVADRRLAQERVVDGEVVDPGNAEDVTHALLGEGAHDPFAARRRAHRIASNPRSMATSTSAGPAWASARASTSRRARGLSTRTARTPIERASAR